jgi:plastocyanin
VVGWTRRGVPEFTSRAGGWDEQRLADQNEKQTVPGDKEGPSLRSAVRALALALLATTAALLAACGDDDGNSTPTPALGLDGGDTGEELVELQLTAEDTRFDKDRLQAPAASEVSLTLDNRDSADHTFSLYPSEGSEDPLFAGEAFAGPSFLTYQFLAPDQPGIYRFQCDVHPDAMAGEFIVE